MVMVAIGVGFGETCVWMKVGVMVPAEIRVGLIDGVWASVEVKRIGLGKAVGLQAAVVITKKRMPINQVTSQSPFEKDLLLVSTIFILS